MAVWTKMIKEDRTMRNNINTFKHLFAALLTIAALAAGQESAQAQTQSTVQVRVSILGCYSSSQQKGIYTIGSNIASESYTYPNLTIAYPTIPGDTFNLGNSDFPLTMTASDGYFKLAEGTSATDITTISDSFTLTFTSSSKYITAAAVTTSDGTAVEGCTVSGTTGKSVSVKIPTQKTFGRVVLTMAVNTPLNFCTISDIASSYIDDGVNHPVPTVTLGGQTLTEGTDYTLSYLTSATSGSVTVTGAGAYTGYKSQNFTIRQPALSDLTVLSDGAYQIATQRDLDYLSRIVGNGEHCSGKTFRQTADITFSHTDDWNYSPGYIDQFESNFTSIGTHGMSFRGTYDGGGHTISGIRISDNDQYGSKGLFGYLSSGTVKDVILRDANVNGWTNVGGIVGYLDNGTVSGCLLYNVRVSTSKAPNQGASVGGIVTGHVGSSTTSGNHYRDCLLCDWEAPEGTTMPYWSNTRMDDLFTVTTAGGVTISSVTGETFAIDAATYYTAGTEVTLACASLSAGYTAVVTNSASGKGVTVADQGSGTFAFTMPAADVTAAVGPINYTITYHLTGGTNGAGNPATYTIESADIVLADATQTDYNFGGWYDNDALSGEPVTTIPAGSTGNVELWAKWTSDHWTGNGTAAQPYMIYTTAQLDQLATYVNNGTDDFLDKYFRLGANLAYDYNTAWNDENSTENNYEPIGGRHNNYDRLFRGDFDGDGHTISGIRIYSGGTYESDKKKGIFGWTGTGANIHNLRLADTRITGDFECGGIVGYNDWGGTISDCHVEATVAIHAVNPTLKHGGIAGINDKGTIRRCTSAVTLTKVSTASGCAYYGGITGLNDWGGTLEDNLAIGATIPAVTFHGAITGESTSGCTLARNYYTACTVAGVADATGVGCNGADVTDNDGAVPANVVAGATAVTVFGESKFVTTFYHGMLDYQLPSGAKAYTASLDGSKVVFHLIGDDGRVIPHGTAAIIVADVASITLTLLASTDVTAYDGNILQGSDTAVTVTDGKVDGKTPYVLGIDSSTLGFYKFSGATIPAGKAYYLKSE